MVQALLSLATGIAVCIVLLAAIVVIAPTVADKLNKALGEVLDNVDKPKDNQL